MPIPQREQTSRFEKGLDRVISFVAPKVALRRAQARESFFQFSYEAAQPNGNRVMAGSRQRNASPENPRSRRDRIRLMWEARQACNDICLMRGLMLKIPMYVVGRLEYRANTGNPEIDKIYEDYFHSWCGSCDLTGRFRFIELTQKALRSMLIDGDVGGLLSLNNGQVKLQLVEADRIGNPDDAENSDNYISGFDLGSFGEVTGVRIFKRSATRGQYSLEGTYSPGIFHHLVDSFRVDQYRGVSHLATAIPHVRDLYELFGYEKVANKFAAMWSAFVYRKDPFAQTGGNGAPGPKWDTTDSATGLKQWEAVAGRVQVMGEGDSIQIAQGSQRPSGAFMNFCDALIRESMISLNLPFGFGYNMAELGGATSRIELEQAQRTFQHWQDLLRHRWINPIKDAVLEHGIASGAIPAIETFRNGEWNFGAFITADVGYRSQADIANIQFGLDSATDVIGRRGGDITRIARNLANEVKVFSEAAATSKTPIEMLSSRWPTGSQQLAAANTPPSPPPAGLVNKTQDLKPLMDLIKQVGDGMLERESAIETVIGIYGVDRQEAETLIPRPTFTSES